jgi:hypothetical protein
MMLSSNQHILKLLLLLLLTFVSPVSALGGQVSAWRFVGAGGSAAAIRAPLTGTPGDSSRGTPTQHDQQLGVKPLISVRIMCALELLLWLRHPSAALLSATPLVPQQGRWPAVGLSAALVVYFVQCA